jgi:glycerophosphoryl diester phosphodiesterase
MISLLAGGRLERGRPAASSENSERVRPVWPSLALPRVMGHRGAAAVAPENTLASLRAAAAMGMTWIEFDVMLSGDGVPVLFHDDNLKRITGRKIAMARTPFADLAKLEAGAWFAPGFIGEPIPSLEQALALAVELGFTPNIEIKPTPRRDAATAAAIVETIARCWPGNRPGPLISSFSRVALEVARDRAPSLPRALIAWRLPRDWESAADTLGCANLHLRGLRLRSRTAAKIKRAGYQLAAFTVNDPKKARRLIQLGVDCIITDRPDVIAAAVG